MKRIDNKDVITRRQLAAASSVGLLSPAIRLLPLHAVQLAGRVSWVSALISIPLGALYVLMLEKAMEKRAEGEGLSDIIFKCIGRTAGRILIGIFAVWFTLYCGFVLRSAAERLLSSVYANGSAGFFMVITLLAAVIAASGQLKSIARTGQAFVFIIWGVLIVSIALSAADIKKENLLPVTYLDLPNVLLGTLPVMDIIGGYTFFLFLGDNVTIKEGYKKTAVKWSLLFGVTLFAIVFVTIGAESAGYLIHNKNPFFVMIRNASFFGIAERIESVVVAIWVLSDFLFLSLLLVIARKTCGIALRVQNDKPLLYPIAAVSYAAAELLARNSFELIAYSRWIVPISSMIIVFVIIPAVLLIGKARSRL